MLHLFSSPLLYAVHAAYATYAWHVIYAANAVYAIHAASSGAEAIYTIGGGFVLQNIRLYDFPAFQRLSISADSSFEDYYSLSGAVLDYRWV